jgi:sedoheptulose-bisphosphatase
MENPAYFKCIEYWLMKGYTLRYSGGMAPDCFHLFKKGEGVFSSVSKKNPKLRVLYEVLPIAFLTEKAGGKTSDGFQSLMDLKITGYE